VSFETEMEKALRHMCTYSSYLLLNSKKINKSYKSSKASPWFHLRQTLIRYLVILAAVCRTTSDL
jgi:hypothetical protein